MINIKVYLIYSWCNRNNIDYSVVNKEIRKTENCLKEIYLGGILPNVMLILEETSVSDFKAKHSKSAADITSVTRHRQFHMFIFICTEN